MAGQGQHPSTRRGEVGCPAGPSPTPGSHVPRRRAHALLLRVRDPAGPGPHRRPGPPQDVTAPPGGVSAPACRAAASLAGPAAVAGRARQEIAAGRAAGPHGARRACRCVAGVPGKGRRGAGGTRADSTHPKGVTLVRFRCDQRMLQQAVARVARAGATSPGLPALAGVHLELTGRRLQLTATDREMVIAETVSVIDGDDGTALVPGRLFADIVRALPSGVVAFEEAGGQATLGGGRSSFRLHSLPTAEFPNLPAVPDTSVTLDASVLAQALRQVIVAASRDSGRPALCGVLLSAEPDGLRAVATDTYRLALRDMPGVHALDDGRKVLVPARALAEVARALGSAEQVVAHFGERDAVFDLASLRLRTRLLEGEFPNYRPILPVPGAAQTRVSVAADDVAAAVGRVNLLARAGAPVRITVSDGALIVGAAAVEIGEAVEELDARCEGTTGMTVVVNPAYLLDGLGAVGAGDVTIEIADPLKPVLVRPSGPGTTFHYLVMPMRRT